MTTKTPYCAVNPSEWADPSVDNIGWTQREGGDGGKDIFVHASVLQRAGIDDLSPGQRVTVDIIEGRKGPEASSIQLI